MRYTVRNNHNKLVGMPGGSLSPGDSRVFELDEKIAEQLKQIDYLDVKRAAIKKKKAKKSAKKQG